MKNYLIRLAFSLMTMVILYGVFYMVGLHTKTFAPFIILPLGIAGGYGALYVYKMIQDAKRKENF
ncbi:hypothetical protein AWM68_02525 [Fictibacillus phosphorivorans]|uniref:Uncharacterized protein n=1 Tax=Fictibacillus phosphorivorans TaxID=1221500 RepID=A0A161TRX1_9BACL|nr:hypothetical protein [Fictibacillus phosphorivorans]KZE69161.1 hypothetical protein AWM68_02525 [Fictibacillus phosphorivorans]